MSELPTLVRVKRKRGEGPTPDLFLEERSTKRSQIWQFRLQQLHPSESKNSGQEDNASGGAEDVATDKNSVRTRPREFRLAIDRKSVRNTTARKRKAQIDANDIPIFVEATQKKRRFEGDEEVQNTEASNQDAKPAPALKKPIANAKERQWRAETWKQSDNATSQAVPNPPSDGVMDALQKFALEEAARDEAREKPRVISIPKKPVQRYRDRHPEEYAAKVAQTQANNGHPPQVDVDVDMDMSDDDDYVYDTYVRTKDPVMLPTMGSDDSAHDQIGYIVITEQDQPFWETYFEDEDSDKEFDTDEDDENAEGYYGADYPEDEVASDDEFDRGAYGYRNAGSDDEQWDSDTGAWSDEGETMQNPWKQYPWMRASRNAAGTGDGEEAGGDADD